MLEQFLDIFKDINSLDFMYGEAFLITAKTVAITLLIAFIAKSVELRGLLRFFMIIFTSIYIVCVLGIISVSKPITQFIGDAVYETVDSDVKLYMEQNYAERLYGKHGELELRWSNLNPGFAVISCAQIYAKECSQGIKEFRAYLLDDYQRNQARLGDIKRLKADAVDFLTKNDRIKITSENEKSSKDENKTKKNNK
jgi:hypothetical protein